MAERGRPRSFDRAAALRRAMEVFWAKGYDGTSLSDLTEAMGINAPSLYAAFQCKEQLFREAVALYGDTESVRIWEPMTSAPTARAAVAAMLRVSAEHFSRPGKPHGCLVVLGAIHADESNAAVWRELRAQRALSLDLLRQRFARAVAEGELSERTDTRAVAAFYLSVQQGMSIQARDGASRKTLLAVADCAMAGWDSLVAAPAKTGEGDRSQEATSCAPGE